MEKLLLVGMVFIGLIGKAQFNKFDNPPIVQNDNYSIELTAIRATDNSCTAKLTIQNKSSVNYMYIDPYMVGFSISENEIYYQSSSNKLSIRNIGRTNEWIIEPNKTSSKVIEVSTSVFYNIDYFNIVLSKIAIGDWEQESNRLEVAPILIKKIGYKGKVTNEEVASVKKEYTPSPVKNENKIVEQAQVPQAKEQTQAKEPQAMAYCEAFVQPNNGKAVRVNIYSEEGKCFTLISSGQKINEQPSSNITFYENDGKRKITIMVEGEGQYEDNMTLINISSVDYKLVSNKKGKYSLKRSTFQLSAEGLAKEAEFDAWAENNTKEFKAANEKRNKEFDENWKKQGERLEELKKEDTEITSAQSNSSTQVSKSNGSGLKFKILYKGKVVCNARISFIQGDVVASGTTDSEGVFYSNFSGIYAASIGINGSKEGTNWELSPFFSLDKNKSSYTVNLEDFEKQMDEMQNVVDMAEDDEASQAMGIFGGITKAAVSLGNYDLTKGCN